MVTLYSTCSQCLPLADQTAPSGLQQLDPPTRARVFMALLGLVLLGVVLVACIMIGGRLVRQLARQSPHSTAKSATSMQISRTTTSANDIAIPTGDTLAGKNPKDETLTD